ncbi:MAG: radical SAM protein [bacterium]|nr:radical SAM protein [bacterium]
MNKVILGKQKVLLVFLPFWTPYIPPQGITTLKSYLEQRDYKVTTCDVSMDDNLRELYEAYLSTLRGFIPYEKEGNFINVGHDVLLNHMMAHINQDDEEKYIELVQILVNKTYYHDITVEQVAELNKILDTLYERMTARLLQLVEDVKPDVFGATAYCGTLAACTYACRLVREHYPHIKTALGGGSFADQLIPGTPNYDLYLEATKDFVDKIFIGEARITMDLWMQGKLPEEQRMYLPKDIGGKTVDISTDVDVPDLSEMNVPRYLFMGATGSRSCPYECSFCNVKIFWGEHRIKDVKQTVKEMIRQYKQYGNQLFFMYDALLNTFITELADEIIASGEPLYFVGYLKAGSDALDPEKVMHWRRGGFYRARLGLESASPKMLDIINKLITPQDIRDTIINLAYAGIKTTAYFISGHPYETEEDFQMTLDMIEELRNDIWECETNPFNYFFTGQQRGDDWADKRMLLYPEYSTNWLLSQTWTLDIEPKREEVYRRMSRLVQLCDRLGVPNPYTIHDIYKADERWKRLHKNAVPSIAEIRDPDVHIDERKNLKNLIFAKKSHQDDGDFIL